MVKSVRLTSGVLRKAIEKMKSLTVHPVGGLFTLYVHPVTKRSWEMRESVCKTDNKLHWRQIHAQAWAEVKGWA